jgi:hypothetical protein
MYLITLACTGFPSQLGPSGAVDIAEEFTHRPWHQNVRCEWDGSALILKAENDWDKEGKALLDEFSDAISACIAEPFDGDIVVRAINVLPE